MRLHRADRPVRTRTGPPKRNVYDPVQIGYRVDFAAAAIIRGGGCTRKFDTCFEMGGGEEVARRLYRRARRNPALAAVLPWYVRAPMEDEYEAAVVVRGVQVYQVERCASAERALEQLTLAIGTMCVWRVSELSDARVIVTRTPAVDEAFETLIDSQYPPDVPGIYRERRYLR